VIVTYNHLKIRIARDLITDIFKQLSNEISSIPSWYAYRKKVRFHFYGMVLNERVRPLTQLRKIKLEQSPIGDCNLRMTLKKFPDSQYQARQQTIDCNLGKATYAQGKK